MAKARLLDVCDTLAVAIGAAIVAADIDLAAGQVGDGNVVTTELTQILALGKANFVTALWPLKPTPGPIYNPNDAYCQTQTPPDVTMTGEVSIAGMDHLIAFNGSAVGAYNVHVLVDGEHVLVQTTTGQTFSQVATAVAAALQGIGIDAVADVNVVQISGALEVICNVGGTGSIATEVYRLTRVIQTSTYAANPETRSLVDDAIVQGIGMVDSQWLTLSDGQAMHVRYVGNGETYVEKAQSSYSAFEAHSFFEVEYPITKSAPATQIGATELTETVGTLPPSTFYGSADSS